MQTPNKLLSATAAKSLVKRIRTHIDTARKLVLELYEGEGWKALGYDSWRACVVAEFGQSQSYLYRLLDAAKIERNLSPIGEKNEPIPEAVLRPLAPLDPEEQRGAWAEATKNNPEPTAKKVRQTVETRQSRLKRHRLRVEKNGIPELLKALDEGRIPHARAEAISDWPREVQASGLAKELAKAKYKKQKQTEPSKNNGHAKAALETPSPRRRKMPAIIRGKVEKLKMGPFVVEKEDRPIFNPERKARFDQVAVKIWKQKHFDFGSRLPDQMVRRAFVLYVQGGFDYLLGLYTKALPDIPERELLTMISDYFQNEIEQELKN